MKEATELEWLQYFFQRADFGPAHEDVVLYIAEDFERCEKKRVPGGYRHCLGEEE